jgi:hypothetical protein
MTTAGGIGHALPFLIPNFRVATGLAVLVVAIELLVISWIRNRYMDTPFLRTAFQVIVGGVCVFIVGILIGSSWRTAMPLRESPERGSATYLELLNSKSNVCAVAIDLLNPHGCSMTSPGIDDHDVDEALWVAYRCYDKSAVTKNLLRRYLPELTFIPNVSADRDVVRKSGGNEATSDTIAAAARARTLTEPVTHAGRA